MHQQDDLDCATTAPRLLFAGKNNYVTTGPIGLVPRNALHAVMMATSTASAGSDYLPNRPPLCTRPIGSALAGVPISPRSPRTPLLGRSISSQFGSPGNSFRAEQEEVVVYDFGSRHIAAGFSGEPQARCVIQWTPDMGRRVGDYRAHYPAEVFVSTTTSDPEAWGKDHEFYHIDTRSLNLGVVEDKLERIVRNIHKDYLQLDSKPRKALLVVPSLLPTPLLEVMLKVMFKHYAQPPAVTLMTTPMLACVGAGQRNALVIEVGWEEAVVTAIGEMKQIHQRRSIRAGKLLTLEMARMIEAAQTSAGIHVEFGTADALAERLAWCRTTSPDQDDPVWNNEISIPLPNASTIRLPFHQLSNPAETVFFHDQANHQDDHDLPLHVLAYRVLLSLPVDLRALAISRIVVTGGASQIPGLKHRLLRELSVLCIARDWDPVHSYGKATAHWERVLQERNANSTARSHPENDNDPSSLMTKLSQENVPHGDRVHDDIRDPTSMKAENRTVENKTSLRIVKGVVRGVETVGAWSAASMLARLRVKGVHEVERENFLKHGLRDVLL